MAGKQVRKLTDAARGERAACDAYQQVRAAFVGSPYINDLKLIEAYHLSAIQKLNQLVASEPDGEPADDAGAWGLFTKLITSTATALGEVSAIRVLRQGEEHGLNLYLEIADDRHIETEIRQLMESEFIPAQQRNIRLLESIIDRIERF